MKVITTNRLNRFWKNGVLPIKNALATKLNTSSVVNNLLTTAAGYALDARQGKALDDKITALNGNIDIYNTWRNNFIGDRAYCFSFGKLNNGYLRSNQIQIPWTSDEVSVALLRINIPGLSIMKIDYKTAVITKHGGLYIRCDTKGAADADVIAGCVAECDIRITKKQ